MKHNIAINGRFLSRRSTGVDRFAKEIIKAIDLLIAQNDSIVEELTFTIITPQNVIDQPPLTNISYITTGIRTNQFWEQWDLPKFTKSRYLLLNLCNTAPISVPKQIVVIHDAATINMPIAFSRSFRLWYRVLMPILGKISRKILTVSEFSRHEISSAFGISPHKISVVIEGGEHINHTPSDAGAIKRFGLANRPYILAVSSMAAHKNFRLVLDAVCSLENPPFDIAIAGGANSRVFGDAGMIHSDRVKWLGYVSDAELRALYESAMCFVFPSLYEGFGIPPLEAMNCGCPVLASDAASIPEVCGDAALYFDPKNPTELATLLMKIAENPALRNELILKGYTQAALFSWEKAARQVIEACHGALA
jgi:glycosyltransferase involved in cell wall biosynthesis